MKVRFENKKKVIQLEDMRAQVAFCIVSKDGQVDKESVYMLASDSIIVWNTSTQSINVLGQLALSPKEKCIPLSSEISFEDPPGRVEV